MAQFSNWDNNKLIVQAHHDELRHSAQALHPWRDKTEAKADEMTWRNRVVTVIAGLSTFVLVLMRHKHV